MACVSKINELRRLYFLARRICCWPQHDISGAPSEVSIARARAPPAPAPCHPQRRPAAARRARGPARAYLSPSLPLSPPSPSRRHARAGARACVRSNTHTHTHTHTHRQAGDESGRMVSSWWCPAVGRLPPPDPPRRQGGPCAPETRSAPPCRRPLPEPPPDPPRPASCRCYLSRSPPCWGVGGGEGLWRVCEDMIVGWYR